MNSTLDKSDECLSELKKQCQYLIDNKDEIGKKKREEYKKSQMELIQNGIGEMKNLKEENISDKELIQSSILATKIFLMLSKLHDKNNEEQTLIIMTYIQVCLSLDDKTDLQYTEFLEKIFCESLFDKSFMNELLDYLTNKKICSCFEDLLEYLK